MTVVPVDATSFSSLPDARYDIDKTFHSVHCLNSDLLRGESRCFTGNFVLDPCWPSKSPGSALGVFCLEEPWSTTLVWIGKASGVQKSSTTAHGPILGLMIVGGTHCAYADGATDTYNGLRLNFLCPGERFLLGEPERSNGLWTIQRVRYRGGVILPVDMVRVATVWIPQAVRWG